MPGKHVKTEFSVPVNAIVPHNMLLVCGNHYLLPLSNFWQPHTRMSTHMYHHDYMSPVQPKS